MYEAPQPLPPSIVGAICQIKTSMDAVKKSQRNPHGGFMFASTDDIYAALTRKMGDVGLVCLVLEDSETEIVRVEKEGKTQQWGRFTFSFVLATKEATWTDPRNRRTLFIQITGPQTFQAANSYAEKSFLRSLFKIPAGEMDLDAMPQGDTEDEQIANAASNGKAKRKSSAEGKRDGSVKTFNEINAKIREAKTADLCKQTWQLYAEELRSMPPKWFTVLAEDFQTRMAAFDVEIDLDNDGWPIIDTQQEAA
jgi:hypothetical protein